MENFKGNKVTKGIIAWFDHSIVDLKTVKICLKSLETRAKCLEVDANDKHVIATIEFATPVNVDDLSDALSVDTLKPMKVESFEVESDTEEENFEPDFEIPKKRAFKVHAYDLSIQGQDLESYQRSMLVWLGEEFKKIEIKSKSINSDHSSSDEDLPSQDSRSEFSDYDSESLQSESNESNDTIEEQSVSCDEGDLKVLRENITDTKTPGLAELNLKKICIRIDENLEDSHRTENLEEDSLVRV